MALKGKNTETAATTEEATPEVVEKEAPTKEVAVKKRVHTPVKTMSGGSVFINNPDFLDAVADAQYGTFVSVVASNGTHKAGKADLGKQIKFQAIIAKEVMKVTPGSNDDEAKDYFQVSEDGETVPDGRSLQEALDDAIDAGYNKAAIKKYIDVICIVTDTENEDFIGETVTLQLSPVSQFTWRPLAGKCKMKMATNRLKTHPILGDESLGSAVIFTSTATPDEYNKKDFTKFVFTMED